MDILDIYIVNNIMNFLDAEQCVICRRINKTWKEAFDLKRDSFQMPPVGYGTSKQYVKQEDIRTMSVGTRVKLCAFNGFTKTSIRALKNNDISVSRCLEIACLGGHSDLVEYILDNYENELGGKATHMRPTNLPLPWLHQPMPDVITYEPFPNEKCLLNYCFPLVCQSGNLDLITLLMTYDLSPQTLDAGFKSLCKYNHLYDIYFLLENCAGEFTLPDDLLERACRKGRGQLVDLLTEYGKYSQELIKKLLAEAIENKWNIIIDKLEKLVTIVN